MEYWRRHEWRLGVFILVGMVLFWLLVFSISHLRFFERGYEVRVLFRFANGIDVGAPVRLAGVKVGEVKNVKIIYDPEDGTPLVEVDLSIKKGVRIRQNAQVMINTLGLLGEKYVEIMPGTKETPLVKDGDILIGHDTVPLARIADLGYKIAKKLDITIEAIKDLFVKEENKQDIEVALKSIRELTTNLNDLIMDADVLIERINKGKGTLGKLLYDDTLYNEILELVRDIKKHPWKLLRRPRRSELKEEGNRGYIYKRK